MAKKPVKPETVKQSAEADAAAPVIELSAEPINMNTATIQSAIAQGKVLIAEGKSKADAARAIYAVIKDESKDVIVAAFVEGATLTPKGALTYWYNNKRRASKERKQD